MAFEYSLCPEKFSPEEWAELQGAIESLEQEKPEQQYFLDMGYKDDEFYYGRKSNGRDQIITSKYRILTNKRLRRTDPVESDQIHDFIPYSNKLSDFAPLMSKEAAQEWLENGWKVEYNPSVIYGKVRAKIDYYMDFGDRPEISCVMALWVMCTYHYLLFWWFPNLLLNCPRESGKSKCSDILLQLTFKGFDLGASAGATPAQLFRTIDACRGTIRLDEFEKLEGECKKLVDQVLNAGVSRGAYVIRNEKIRDRHVPTKFPIFCPKIACNISGINATSLTRFIAFSWLKTSSPKANLQPTTKKELETFEPIRDLLYLYGLQYWQEILKLVESVSTGLSGRANDNFVPLFAVASLIKQHGDSSAETDLKKFLSTCHQVDIDCDDSSEEFLRSLHEQVASQKTLYLVSDIAKLPGMAEMLGFTKSPSHWIGKKLTEYKFEKSRRSAGRAYLLSKEEIQKRIDLYFNGIDNSTNNIHDTKDTNSTNDITSEKKAELISVHDISDVSAVSEVKGDKGVVFDKTRLAWQTCAFCGDSPCNEWQGKYYCAKHFVLVQGFGQAALIGKVFAKKVSHSLRWLA